ncbi:MAG: hypothetical protein ACRDLB_02895 [Actinomycetota bacterium]
MTRRLPVSVMTLVLVMAFAIPMSSLSVRAKGGATVVGEDPSGDWNQGVGAPLGDTLGEDLIKATIASRGRKTVVFGITLNSLATVEVPATSYAWDFAVEGEEFRLIKHPCNAPGGPCPSTVNTFDLTVCGVETLATLSVTSCEPVASIEPKVDEASATIEIPVPLDALGARPGDVITPRNEPSLQAFVPGSVAPNGFAPLRDTLTVSETFTIPKRGRSGG